MWHLPPIQYLSTVIAALSTSPKNAESLGKVRAICHLLQHDNHYRQRAQYLRAPLREFVKQVPLLPRTTSTPLDEHQLIVEELHATIKALEVPRA